MERDRKERCLIGQKLGDEYCRNLGLMPKTLFAESLSKNFDIDMISDIIINAYFYENEF